MSRRILQIVVAAAGIVPVGAGLLGVLLGPGMILAGGHVSVSQDSHWRYLSGLLLGIGVAFWSTIPRIEAAGRTFRLLTGIVVVGGLARLWALLTFGRPDAAMLFGLAMELLVTPALAVWQYQLAQGGAK